MSATLPVGITLERRLESEWMKGASCLAWLPNRPIAVLASPKLAGMSWLHIDTGQERFIAEHAPVIALVTAEDGTRIYGAYADGTVRIRHLVDGGNPGAWVLCEAHQTRVRSLAITSRYLYSGGWDGRLIRRRAEDLRGVEPPLYRGARIHDVVVSPNARKVAACHESGITIVDTEKSLISTMPSSVEVSSIDWLDDERYLVTGRADGEVIVRDTLRADYMESVTLAHPRAPVLQMRRLGGSRLFLSQGGDGLIRIWRASDWCCVAVLEARGKSATDRSGIRLAAPIGDGADVGILALDHALLLGEKTVSEPRAVGSGGSTMKTSFEPGAVGSGPSDKTADRKLRGVIFSSSEGLFIANTVQMNMAPATECAVWNQGQFELSRGNLDNIAKALKQADFAIVVFTPDDDLTTRGRTRKAPRHNVVLEFGLAAGMLGPQRTFGLFCPSDDLELPSDLDGIMMGTFERADNMQAALGPACTSFKTALGLYKKAK